MKPHFSFQNIIPIFKKHRIALLLGAALALGGLAAVGIKSHVNDFLASEREKLAPKVKLVEVVVAKRNLKAGDVVGPETMAVRSVPEAYAHSQAIRPDRFEGFVGAKLGQTMQGGEALLSTSLVGADVATFSSKVRPGIRAMTISVDEVNSVSGMLQPGDRIDLMMSIKPPLNPSAGASGTEVTVPLIQDILVLATGRQVRAGGAGDDAGQRGFSAITVEVAPDQAQRLVVAQRGGKLTAMLRNPADRHELPKKPMDVYALLGLRAPNPVTITAAVPPPSTYSPLPAVGAEIIVGGKGPLSRPVFSGNSAGAAALQDGASNDAGSPHPKSSAPREMSASPSSEPSGGVARSDAVPQNSPAFPHPGSGSRPVHGLPQSLLEVR